MPAVDCGFYHTVEVDGCAVATANSTCSDGQHMRPVRRKLRLFERLEERLALATYYVSNQGSDSQDGSTGTPWATLQRAANIVSPGDTVIVRAGTYAGFDLRRDGTAPRLALVVEEYCSFIGNEIRALRAVGADLDLLAAFRPLPELDPADEALRREALYFPASAAGIVASVAAALARTPRAFAAVVIRMVREGVGVRMAALACCFAQLARTRRISHLQAFLLKIAAAAEGFAPFRFLPP